jgi:group II intron reverse transcriptase/maturase
VQPQGTFDVPKVDMNTANLMEKITFRENMLLAFKRVKDNRGAPGIDGITTADLQKHLQTHWQQIREQLLQGRYKPKPVRRVPIPKSNGGTRELGIPTTTDRLIQQAILQVLTPVFDPTFSESSYGFRPQRSAHQAVRKAKEYINAGYTTVVDLDLEKFFDTVNHDRLMHKLSKTIEDKRLLKLIRRYLQAGIMNNGVCIRTTVGTPQGGPLSPLLANIVLDELDKELEKRGHRFCRYADDCNIYVKTPRAGQRVMQSLTRFIGDKLELKVNQEKSAVDRPTRRKFLSFSFYWSKAGAQICIAPKAKKRLKDKIRALTSRRQKDFPLQERIDSINQYLRGWIGYFALAEAQSFLGATDATLKRRLRMCIWKRWHRIRTRYDNLRTLGMNHTDAIKYANTRKGYWRIAGSTILTTTLTNQYFKDLGLLSLAETYRELRSN